MGFLQKVKDKLRRAKDYTLNHTGNVAFGFAVVVLVGFGIAMVIILLT